MEASRRTFPGGFLEASRRTFPEGFLEASRRSLMDLIAFWLVR